MNSGLTTPLGTKPNDECYTSMKDILDELSKWGTLGKFKGKRIVCPCDWDISSDSDVYQINIEYDCNKNVKTSSISDNIKSIVYKKFDLSKLLNDEVIETVHSISVKPEEVDDAKIYKVARDIKKKVESEMQYPGTIKINVIRETRVAEEAK